MLSQIGLIHLFCSPYYHKAAAGFLFFSSFGYQGHTNKQLPSLADNFITQWLELFYKIQLILYCEHYRHFAKEMGVLLLLHVPTKA